MTDLVRQPGPSEAIFKLQSRQDSWSGMSTGHFDSCWFEQVAYELWNVCPLNRAGLRRELWGAGSQVIYVRCAMVVGDCHLVRHQTAVSPASGQSRRAGSER